VSFQCKLDSGTYSDCTSPKTYPDLSADRHTFSVIAVDQFGQPSDAASYSWQVNPVDFSISGDAPTLYPAGAALEAARRGDWAEAVRLSRESGRSAARGGVAAGETVMLAHDIADAGTAIRRRIALLRASIPPTPPSPPRLEEPPRPPRPGTPEPRIIPSEAAPIPIAAGTAPRADGLTGTVVHDGAAGPQRPTRQFTRPHSA
jgi:hypothetical protein